MMIQGQTCGLRTRIWEVPDLVHGRYSWVEVSLRERSAYLSFRFQGFKRIKVAMIAFSGIMISHLQRVSV